MAKELLRRDEFRAWLEANEQAVVGRPGFMNGCPLAKFLQESKSHKMATVGWSLFNLGRKTRHLPRWASRFAQKVDKRYASNTLIRGRQALRILDATAE